MPIQARLVPSGISDEQFDRLARECKNELVRQPGVDVIEPAPVSSEPGRRGDPVTIGTFALALVTSGVVTALFNILKSYVERGVDGTFEGVDTNGKSRSA